MYWYEAFEAIEKQQGNNAKQDLVTKFYQEVTDFSEMLKAALDPFVTYGVKDVPPPQPAPTEPGVNQWSLLRDLSTRKLSGNVAKTEIASALSRMNELERKWFARVLRKDLQCGIDVKSVNKKVPGAIPVFEVALASEVEAYRNGEELKILSPIKYPVWCDFKLDGIRVLTVKKNGSVLMYSRNGHLVESLPHIQLAVAELPFDNIVLDGEAMGRDWNESQSVISSKKNKKDTSNMLYHVFDAIDLKEWICRSTQSYMGRLTLLNNILDKTAENGPIRSVPGILAQNEKDVLSFYKFAIPDVEGVMIKDMDAPYQFKRSKAIMKLKPKQRATGIITGVEPGDKNGKWAGKFGAFQVRFVDTGPVTSVGGGYTDKDRIYYTNGLAHPELYIGRYVEVEFQEMTPDGLARFPVFIGFRHEADF